MALPAVHLPIDKPILRLAWVGPILKAQRPERAAIESLKHVVREASDAGHALLDSASGIGVPPGTGDGALAFARPAVGIGVGDIIGWVIPCSPPVSTGSVEEVVVRKGRELGGLRNDVACGVVFVFIRLENVNLRGAAPSVVCGTWMVGSWT